MRIPIEMLRSVDEGFSLSQRRATKFTGIAMASFLQDLLDDKPGRTGTKVIAIFVLLVFFNLAAWAWALTAFHHYPVLLGTAFLAYSFGLRHAVDADHIAAIDNVSRKLMQEGK